jgi:hypothetical protein
MSTEEAGSEEAALDPRTAAWRELSPIERVLILHCDEPGVITETGRRAAGVLRDLRREQRNESAPPSWWRSTWRP